MTLNPPKELHIPLVVAADAPPGYEDIGNAVWFLTLDDAQWILGKMQLVWFLKEQDKSVDSLTLNWCPIEFGEIDRGESELTDDLVTHADWVVLEVPKRHPWKPARTDDDKVIVDDTSCYFTALPHNSEGGVRVDTHRLSREELEGYARDLLAKATVVAVTKANDRRVRSRRRVIDVDAPTKDG